MEQKKPDTDKIETRGVKRTRASVAALASPSGASPSGGSPSVAAIASPSVGSPSVASLTSPSLDSPSMSKTKVVCTAKMQKAAVQALYQKSFVRLRKLNNLPPICDFPTNFPPIAAV